MKANLYRPGALAIALGAAVLAVSALAPAPAGAAGAQVVTQAGGIHVLPNVGYERAVLTIRGNGETQKREIAAGRPILLGLVQPGGLVLTDGAYRWELDLVPNEAEAKSLREAAQQNGRAADAWRALSGTFTVRGGAIADPNLLEPEPARAAPSSTLGEELSAASSGVRRRSAAAMDSDGSGAVEHRRAALGTEFAAVSDGPPGADADGGAATEAPAALRAQPALVIHTPKPADGSNGRTPGSTPNR